MGIEESGRRGSERGRRSVRGLERVGGGSRCATMDDTFETGGKTKYVALLLAYAPLCVACRRRGRASASPDMGARIRTRSRAAHREEKLKERQEAAALTQKLLQASASGGGVAKSGKVVNAYGQEEVGISRREAKASALRDMYASSTEKGVGRVIFADKL